MELLGTTGTAVSAAAVAVAYLVVVNMVAFAAFGMDKRRARRGAWRIPERVLMALAAIGGSIGAFAGMKAFRHKTRKRLFAWGIPLILVAQAVLAAVVVHAAAMPGNEPAPVSPGDFQEATVDYVIDGDTVDVIVDGAEKRVRLAGIDAPESASHDEGANTPEGALATEFARALLPKGRVVYLQKDVSETDKYGRLVRYVWLERPTDARDADEVGAKMANAVIVGKGYAKAYRYYPDIAYQEHFEAAQQRAIEAGAGVSHLWA